MKTIRGNKLYLFLLSLSIIGIIDTLFLIIIGTPINFGILFPGIAGVLLIGYILIIGYKYDKWSILRSELFIKAIRISVVFVIISFLIAQGVILSGMKPETGNDVKYVIILGGGLDKDEFTVTAKNRVDKALSLLRKNDELIAIASGGKEEGEQLSEAEHYKKYLVENGIDEERVLVETKSTSTMENYKFSKEILKENADFDNKIYVVTSGFHLYRAKMLARRNGLIPFGVPAKTQLLILPNNLIREYFALIKSITFDRN